MTYVVRQKKAKFRLYFKRIYLQNGYTYCKTSPKIFIVAGKICDRMNLKSSLYDAYFRRYRPVKFRQKYFRTWKFLKIRARAKG